MDVFLLAAEGDQPADMDPDGRMAGDRPPPVDPSAAACQSPHAASPTYVVPVRALCEFAAKQGDLDLRFTPSPTSQEGTAGHRAVAARRGPAYQAEVALSATHRNLLVRGRADGYDAKRRLLVEVKTFKGELDRMPANHRSLHWAQAKVYGWMLCESLGLAEIDVSLVYFDVGAQR